MMNAFERKSYTESLKNNFPACSSFYLPKNQLWCKGYRQWNDNSLARISTHFFKSYYEMLIAVV